MPANVPAPYLLAYFVPLLLGLAISLAAGHLLLPVLRRLKARQVVSTDAPRRHQSKGGTPTMGGLILLAGALIPAFAYRTTGEFRLLLAVALTTLAFGAIGFLDDFLIVRRGKNLGLRAREKLAAQFAVAIAFTAWFHWAYPGPAPITEAGLPAGRLALAAYQVLLVVGLSNAVNLTDGLDGLAAGVSLPVWLVLATLALVGPGGGWLLTHMRGDYGVLAFAAAAAGATLGYLWFNAHPAQVFMGDTGSLAMGGGMAAAAIALGVEWLLPLAALVHLAEAGSVVLQVASFKMTGRRIFRMSPLHHHFELCEVPETRIVARFTIASAACGVLALIAALWS